jgi:hypothetical protein
VQSASRVGRPQRPVDAGVGPGQELALALRKLREDNGNPTYRAMAERAHYSASALARAASGGTLPSRELVLAYVRACGGDQAEWDQRWAAAAARSGHNGQREPVSAAATARSGHDGEPEPARHDSQAWEHREGTPRRRPRRMAIALAAVSALAAAGVALLLPGQRHPASYSPASPSSPRPTAGNSSSATSVPVRRHGLLVLAADQVADLDTLGGGWGIVTSPGSASDDVWFGSTDHALHGNRNADIAILPVGSAGTFSECALEQDYGVTLDAPRIRPGQLICNITSDNRVALLRIVNVRRAADGTPDQITFDVTVWVPLHKT